MKMRIISFRLTLFFLLVVSSASVKSQDAPAYRKHGISFNMTRLAFNEFNISYEHWISMRKSMEFSFGYMYENTFLQEQVEDWTNAVFVYENGFAGRFHYKIHERSSGTSRWHDYIAPGISFKSLNYKDRPGASGTKNDVLNFDSIMTADTLVAYTYDDVVTYTETFLQDRKRYVLGLQFLWGKVLEASKTISLEFYFGASLDLTMSKRTDHNRFATYNPKNYTVTLPDSTTIIVRDNNRRRNQSIPDFTDETFYARPTIQAGIKLLFRL